MTRKILTYGQTHLNTEALQQLRDAGWGTVEAGGMATFHAGHTIGAE